MSHTPVSKTADFEPKEQADLLIRKMVATGRDQAVALRLALLYVATELLIGVSGNTSTLEVLGVKAGEWYQLPVLALHVAAITSLTVFRSAGTEVTWVKSTIAPLLRRGDGSFPPAFSSPDDPKGLRLWNVDESMNYIDYIEGSVKAVFSWLGWRWLRGRQRLVYPAFEGVLFLASWFAAGSVAFETLSITAPWSVWFLHRLLVTLALVVSGLFLFQWVRGVRGRLRPETN